MSNLYEERDIIEQGEHYTKHISAMTREGLHSKSAIAAELAHRDMQLEQAEARVAEHEEEMKLFTAAAVMICQQESDEWDSDRLKTYKDYAEVCGQRIAKLTPVNARAWLLRKQAEAMERAIDSSYGFTQMAQRLRQQADEIERQSDGGE